MSGSQARMFDMVAATSSTCGQGENLIYFLCDCSKNVLDIPGRVLNFEGSYVRKNKIYFLSRVSK